MEHIFDQVRAERKRQDEKWGPQSWPSVDTLLEGRGDMQRLCEEYEIPTENRAKFLCENAFEKKRGTWAHIAIEEMAEVVSAGNEIDRYKELIQLIAVCVAWVQDIQNRAYAEAHSRIGELRKDASFAERMAKVAVDFAVLGIIDEKAAAQIKEYAERVYDVHEIGGKRIAMPEPAIDRRTPSDPNSNGKEL